ncbi:hypothetical protein FA13DRAFT_1796299 [Coprinellus micaceus]|uniref:Uncharacterized protein n=1 Tax=Coprinellus micaceus TaxID=71717 RepID=A0A4Y7SVE1_COPMI|nr:hypothetical protein FA13DRAFT_1796299 [Coprinellus micaceus]
MPSNRFVKGIKAIYRDLMVEDVTERVSSMKSDLRILAEKLMAIEQKVALIDKHLQASQARGLPEIGPSGPTPRPEAPSDDPTVLVAKTSTTHAGETAPSPQGCAPSASGNVTSSSHPGTTQSPRPLSVPLETNSTSSASSLMVVEGQGLKPTALQNTLIDVGFDSGSEMKLLSPEESRAMVNLLNMTADKAKTGRASSMKTQKNRSNGDGTKSTEKQAVGSGSRPRGKRKRKTAEETNGKAKSSGKGREEPRDLAGMEGTTSTIDEGETKERPRGSEESGGAKKVRKRAEKEQKTCWSFITIPAKMQAGVIVDTHIRVLTWVDESDSDRQKLNREHPTLFHRWRKLAVAKADT